MGCSVHAEPRGRRETGKQKPLVQNHTGCREGGLGLPPCRGRPPGQQQGWSHGTQSGGARLRPEGAPGGAEVALGGWRSMHGSRLIFWSSPYWDGRGSRAPEGMDASGWRGKTSCRGLLWRRGILLEPAGAYTCAGAAEGACGQRGAAEGRLGSFRAWRPSGKSLSGQRVETRRQQRPLDRAGVPEAAWAVQE